MSIFESRPLTRWAVPAAAAALAIGAVAVPSSAKADELPVRSAEQLLVDVQQARVDGLSGTLSETADLGLPTLPAGMGGAQGTSLSSLVTGTHTARVWVAGEHLSRIAVQAGADETNIVRNATDVWHWSSASQTATHVVLPTEEQAKAAAARHEAAAKEHAAKHPAKPVEAQVPATPQEAAQKVVAALSRTSDVTTTDNTVVAGRPAYELVLTPKDSTTRVASVRIAIDGEKHVPTRVQVFSTRMASPAVELGFTSVDFRVPAASVFAFTPARGAKVETTDLTKAPADHGTKAPAADHTDLSSLVSDQRTVGTGWAEIAVGRVDVKKLAAEKAAAEKEAAAAKPEEKATPHGNMPSGQVGTEQLLDLLPKANGAWGTGRVLDGTLVSVVVTDDGRYALGAVAPDALYAALPAK